MSPIQFDPEAIRSLALILRDAGLTEIELVEADRRIRISRAAPAVAVSAAAAPAASAAPEPAAPATTPAEEAAPANALTSPMVGVAFLSPEPGSPPFVQPGQAVAAGQTVLLIEAMKTFNQIKAAKAGTIGRILVSNGQPVEYGQPLIVID